MDIGNLNYWESVYNEPIENIPWNRTQADYFKHLIDQGRTKGETALDIGCGIGKKSVYLAQNGFQVVGIDISPAAISYCMKNAHDAGITDRIQFLAGDIIADLKPLKGRKFDFILDWDALHCIDQNNHSRYYEKIIELSHPETIYLLRVFSSKDPSIDHFIDKKANSTDKVCVMQKKEILDMFSEDFELIEYKTSKPKRYDDLFFMEFLMRRR